MSEDQIKYYLQHFLLKENRVFSCRSSLTREQIKIYSEHNLDIEKYIVEEQVSYLSKYILESQNYTNVFLSVDDYGIDEILSETTLIVFKKDDLINFIKKLINNI